MTSRPVLLVAACLLAPACQTPAAPGDAKEAPPKTEAKAPEVESKAPAADDLPGAPVKPLPEERHFKSLRQLTFGGENAEAYLSFDEKQLVFQSTRDGGECDQIYTMPLDPPTPA